MTCSLLFSYEKVRAGNELIRLYRELVEALDRMSANLRFRTYDVYQLCEASFEGSDELAEFKNITGCFKTGWENACRLSLKKIDQNTFHQCLGVGGFLGEYDLDSQLKKLEYISADIRKRLEKLETEQSKKKKLYYSIGLFSGMMICLILI